MSNSSVIIDRRKNSGGKSIPNRVRFINRSKRVLKEAAKGMLPDRKITSEEDQQVVIPNDGIREPNFVYDSKEGWADHVIVGNDKYVVGDTIPKDPPQDSGRGGGGGGGDGEGDSFGFILTYDEFINLIFDDLELPDLIKESEKNTWIYTNRRAGYTPVGVPSNLNIERTAISGIARRMAFKAPKQREIDELEARLKVLMDMGFDGDHWTIEVDSINQRITELKASIAAIGFLDDVDLKYNNFVKDPQPVTSAVVFMMMDVSGSMGEREKTIAKKFFILLHLFLKKRYKKIEVVFVRHHDTAYECDEDMFFTARDSGGTRVSTGYEVIEQVIQDRYPLTDWNIYVAQATDGDNFSGDMPAVEQMLPSLLSKLQYFIYAEIEPTSRMVWNAFGATTSMHEESDLWATMNKLAKKHDNMSATTIRNEESVLHVFREIFKKANK